MKTMNLMPVSTTPAALSFAAALLAVPVLAGGPPAGRPSITPSLVRLSPGASQQFSFKMAGHSVSPSEWSVNGVPGGSPAFGRISAAGVYTAPAAAPVPHEIHIGALVQKPAALHAWATVVMGAENPTYKLISHFGEKGVGPGKFTDPHAIRIDRDGNLIIIDSTPSHVYRYTKDGRYLGEIGKGPGSAPGQFNGPRDVEVDAAGNIFISDGNNGRIEVFSPSGEFLRMFGKKGKEPGDMLRVHAIWFGPGDRLYAADVDNSRIMVFNNAGKFLSEWGKDGRGPGEFHAPHGLGGDANGDLFVSNYWGPCQKFTGDGQFLFDFAPVSESGGPTHWHAMTSDRWGNAYLMSRDKQNRNSIMKYNNNGTFVTSWPPLRDVGEWGVKDATVDQDGTVYVCVESKERVGIEVYRED